MAVNADAARFIAAVTVVIRGPFGVMHDPEVQFAVAIEIEPARRYGPFSAFDARLLRGVFETAVAEIVIEDVAVHTCDEEIGVAVVIVIAYRGAHGIAFADDSGFGGYIAEFQIAFVVIEAVPILRSGLGEGRKLGAIGEEDIRTAVAIVIENYQPARHGFDHVLLRSRAVMQDEIDAALRGDVLEANRSGRGTKHPSSAQNEEFHDFNCKAIFTASADSRGGHCSGCAFLRQQSAK